MSVNSTTDYLPDTRTPRTGAYVRVIVTGEVFYTANPTSYTRSLRDRQTYARICRHCSCSVWIDGQGSWIDATDGDGCDPDVHEAH